MEPGFWNKKSFILITGASRGLGRTMAIKFAKKVAPGSVFLLLARTSAALTETKSLVEKVSSNIQVEIATIDLTNPNKLAYFDLINTAAGGQHFDHAILVHNAASIGNVSLHVSQMEDEAELQDYYNFNIVSMIVLTSQFFQVFSDPTRQRSIVQVSSGAGVEPIKNMGCYCSGKAARDMLIKVMAQEDPSVAFLSFNPGMFESDMQTEARTTVGDPEVREMFSQAKAAGMVGTAENSVEKLIFVLGQQKFVKGEQVHIREIVD